MYLFNRTPAPQSPERPTTAGHRDYPDGWSFANTTESQSADNLSRRASRRNQSVPSVKRQSVFNAVRPSTGRSRSYTTVPSSSSTPPLEDSSYASRTSTMTGTDFSSRRPSLDTGDAVIERLEALERPASRARQLFSQSRRRLKRQGSKLSIASMASLASEDEPTDLPLRQKMSQHEREHSVEVTRRHRLKESISTPFNFQHLTHTEREQLPALENSASETRLAAEFTAVRARQIPRVELDGIHADDLHSRAPSADAVPKRGFAAPLATPWPSLGAQASMEKLKRQKPAALALRHTKSSENFAQLKARVLRNKSSQITPPPRLSSLAAQTSPRSLTSPCSAASASPLSLSEAFPAGIQEEPSETTSSVPQPTHAFTTFGAASAPALTIDPTKQGEPEIEFMNSPEPPEAYPSISVWNPHLESPTFTRQMQAQSPGSDFSASFEPGQSALPTPRSAWFPRAGARDTLMPRRPSRGSFISGRDRVASGCWEDDIDWCYEHEADADFDFEWSQLTPSPLETSIRRVSSAVDVRRVSVEMLKVLPEVDEGAPRPSTSLDTRAEEDYVQSRFFDSHKRPSLLVSMPEDVPELVSGTVETTPSVSAISIDTPAQSFSEGLPAPTSTAAVPDSESPLDFMMHTPIKMAILQEAMYEEMLADCSASDKHYSLFDHHHPTNQSLDLSRSKDNSARSSSATRLSKSSSTHDSCNTWSSTYSASRVHRSDSCTSSVPDLVPSSRSTGTGFESKHSATSSFDMAIPAPPPPPAKSEAYPFQPKILSPDLRPAPLVPSRNSSATAIHLFADKSAGHERAASDSAAKLLDMAGPRGASVVAAEKLDRAASRSRSRSRSVSHSRNRSRSHTVGSTPPPLSLFPSAPKVRELIH